MCIKMLQFSGHRETMLLKDLSQGRAHLISGFNNLRKSVFWKKHVDGGAWFYEYTTDASDQYVTIDCLDGPSDIGTKPETITWTIGDHTTVHPHLHCLILSPKKIPMPLLNQELRNRGLGDAWVTVPKDKNGNIIEDDKMSINRALGYALKYLDKNIQIDGRNRGTFGSLYRKKAL